MSNAAAMMNDGRFLDYMKWVREGIVFFLRPHQSLLKDDGVRAGVSWDSVLRIDGMVKLMLEQHRISYLPLESVSRWVAVLGHFISSIPSSPTRPSGLAPAGPYVPHPLHDSGRDWPETNCYVDLWIELLHGRGPGR